MSAAVYGFVNADGLYLYIGCTEKLEARLAAHRRKPWWPEVTGIHLIGTGLRIREARDLERRSIETFEPVHNIAFTRVWRELHAADGRDVQTRPLTVDELARIHAAYHPDETAVAS